MLRLRLLATDKAQAGPGCRSRYAATQVHDYDRPRLEILIKYISRPPVAMYRLSKAGGGLLQNKLKTPFRDGKTHVLLSPEEHLEKPTAIITRPRSHNTKYSAVFAPHDPLRETVTIRPEMKKGFESPKYFGLFVTNLSRQMSKLATHPHR